MKKSVDNIEHRIQLKKDEIERYKRCIVNYPPARMEKCGTPYLNKLLAELEDLYKEKSCI